MKKIRNKRTIRICRKTVERRYKRLLHLPNINLSGIWLRDCGFEVGQAIEITYSPGVLVITLSSENRDG